MGPENTWLMSRGSCENPNTTQPPITGCEEATLAAVWKGVVCRMYDAHYWKFVKGWNTYVMPRFYRNCWDIENMLMSYRQALWHSTNIKHC